MNKRGFEFSFGWLFALIVGAAILFLAIYAAVKIVGTEKAAQETGAAKQLETILIPVETGYEEGKSVAPITFSSETRLYNNCTNDGDFGEQIVRITTSSGIGKTWQDEGFPITSYNKYIFSQDVVQGKEMYVFSKPFDMPFKVANVLFIWSGKYCFVNPPAEINSEVNSLGLRNINLTDDITNCDKSSKKVCFVSNLEQCDVLVDPNEQTVKHKGKKIVNYQGSLIYGAIFAEPEVYECQFKRLMKRTSELANIYNAKSENLASRANGCSADLQGNLQDFASITSGANKSEELRDIYFSAQEIKNKNDRITDCKLW